MLLLLALSSVVMAGPVADTAYGPVEGFVNGDGNTMRAW